MHSGPAGPAGGSQTVRITSYNVCYTKLLRLGFLRILTFILVIAAVVQFTEMAVKRLSPVLHQVLGIFLPLITTNCAILGLAIFQTNRGYNFIEGLFFALGGGLGLTSYNFV